MTKLAWHNTGDNRYETGVDRGVLYLPTNGNYNKGVAWNGLKTVTETPAGAESNPQYADNTKYLNLLSAETFGGTLEAFMYPDEFAQCDGTAIVYGGISVGQQTRKPFGLAYRTKVGNELDPDLGYKIHLVYGALAAPSEKAYSTVNDSPEAMALSWTLTTTPVEVPGNNPDTGKPFKPTALLTIDSTKYTVAQMTALEDILYGTAGQEPRLPLPEEVFSLFQGATTAAVPTKPTWTAATHVVTIPTVVGIKYTNDATGATIPSGPMAALTAGQSIVIRALPLPTYTIAAGTDTDWQFNFADA